LQAKVKGDLGKAKNIKGFAVWNGQIWTVSPKSKLIKSHKKNELGKLSVVEEVKHDLKNPVGIAWTGSEYLILDGKTKVIVQVDPKTKVQQVYVDLLKLKESMVTSILKAKGSSISAITFNQGIIWITLAAGYSSSIIAFNYATKELVNNFYTRGSEPLGITFDASGKFGWVLDGGNKELSQFDLNGKWTGTILSIPLERPLGLAIDNQGNFLVGDAKTQRIYELGGV
jgi:hypothetical protein